MALTIATSLVLLDEVPYVLFCAYRLSCLEPSFRATSPVSSSDNHNQIYDYYEKLHPNAI